MTSTPSPPEPPTRLGSRWRGLLFFLPMAFWTLGMAGLIGVMGMISPSFQRGGYVAWVRVWGRVPLWLSGVRLEVHGLEHRDAPGPKILIFNHVSLLDLFVLGSLAPEKAVVLYKKEFARVPGMGMALKSLGMISIDRKNHQAAVRSVARASERLREERATLMMAPEGTRSRRGGLQEFKLGAFHLAATHGIPLVPMIMRGIETVLPMGSVVIRSGRVSVDYLPPIDTSTWSAESARSHAKDVREQFLEYLPAEVGTEAE